MKLILNEVEMVSKSLEEGYIDKKESITIKLLIKYYFSKGMDRNQVRQCIEDFLHKNLKGFNVVKWDTTLDRYIKNEEKLDHRLTVIEKVDITKKELETISNINNKNLEKLAFTYLVYSKIYNQLNENDSNWVNESRQEVFRDSKIPANPYNQGLMINDLVNMGLIENSRRRNCGNKKVLFVDNEGETEITITDFREIVYVYLKWKGENIGECEKCGRLIKISGKNHKMCKDCWRDKQKEWQRKSMKKLRENRDVKFFE